MTTLTPTLKKGSSSIFSSISFGNIPSRTSQVNQFCTTQPSLNAKHTSMRMRVVSTMTNTGTRTAAKATPEKQQHIKQIYLTPKKERH